MCASCLDRADDMGQNYFGMKVEVVVVSEGESWCVPHYRAYRDRNKISQT